MNINIVTEINRVMKERNANVKRKCQVLWDDISKHYNVHYSIAFDW